MSENLATIEDVRKYHFDPKEVIKGLNGYYESDKCNSYITVRRNDVEGPAYLSTPIYLSALIEWLREDYDIFYRPGLTLGLETKSIEEIVDWIITMATCPNKSDISDRIHEICNAKGIELDDAFLYDDDYTWEDLVGFLCEEIRKLKIEVEDALNDVIKKLKELLNEINKEEDEEWFKP